MGHSRGGDAVTDFIAYNRNLPGGSRRFVLDGVLSLAPTYSTSNTVPYGTNYATLLPACDGDVSNLQGGRFFENAKHHPGNATTAKIQWYVQGTDHNVFRDVDVTLVDADGRRATTNAARWSTSLQPSIGLRHQHVVLNGIRIPLSAFAGEVDLTRIAEVELGFGARTPTGAIQLADVAFQESSPDGGQVCADATRPSSRMTRMAVSRRAVRVSGIAMDAGCPEGTGPAAGGVERTLVQISRTVKGGCRFVTAKGRLTKRRSCDEPVVMFAKGTRSWSLAIDGARLPRGVYAVRVTTYDRSGNATQLKTRRVRVG